MGAKFTIKVEGVEKVSKYLNAKKEEIQKAVTGGIRKAALYLEGETKESISGHKAETRSVDTGRFMGSVSSKMIDDNSAIVWTDISYSKHLEYGTSRIAPRWHFRNTKARSTEPIQKIIKGEVAQIKT